MKLSDFMYDLPEERIAQTPVEPRDHSRLMVVHRDSGAIEAFDSEDVTVEAGNDKNSVVISQTVTVAGSMAKLYMTCVLE